MALYVGQGWHVRYLAALAGGSVALSLVVVALVTFISHEVEIGLSAGSYTIGVTTSVLALFTLFSAAL